jgi:hypothetical protein
MPTAPTTRTRDTYFQPPANEYRLGRLRFTRYSPPGYDFAPRVASRPPSTAAYFKRSGFADDALV